MSSVSLHQRATGALRIAWRRRGVATVLDDLRQEGCLKARFPRAPGGAEAVSLNSSGGVAGGDRLRTEIALAAGARATLAAQAAERFYRALPEDPPADIATLVELAEGAALDWLPQEAILFDRCAVRRRLDVSMAEDARFLGIEALVFGRAAMGETLRAVRLSDTIRIRRAGRLVLHDAIRLDGPAAEALAGPALAAGAGAMATIVLVAPDSSDTLDAVRDTLASQPGVEAGVSSWDGMLVARVLAPDALALRRATVAALAVLRGGRALPRVWLC